MACEVAQDWSLVRGLDLLEEEATPAVEVALLRVAQLSVAAFAYRYWPLVAQQNSRVRSAGTRFLKLALARCPLDGNDDNVDAPGMIGISSCKSASTEEAPGTEVQSTQRVGARASTTPQPEETTQVPGVYGRLAPQLLWRRPLWGPRDVIVRSADKATMVPATLGVHTKQFRPTAVDAHSRACSGALEATRTHARTGATNPKRHIFRLDLKRDTRARNVAH
ncbi:hypothetical protein MTO96_021327 [Rhipicephalus appendiculatus]